MDAVTVEVAAGAVVVLGGPPIGVAGEDLGVPERDSRVESVGDRDVPQLVRADVTRELVAIADVKLYTGSSVFSEK